MDTPSHDLPRFVRPLGLTHAGHSAVRRRHTSFAGLARPLEGILSRRPRALTLRTTRSASLSYLALASAAHPEQPATQPKRVVHPAHRPDTVTLDTDGPRPFEPRSPAARVGEVAAPGPVGRAASDESGPPETPSPSTDADWPAVAMGLDPTLLSTLREADAAGGDRSIRQFVDRLSALQEHDDGAPASPSPATVPGVDSEPAPANPLDHDRTSTGESRASTVSGPSTTAPTPDRQTAPPRGRSPPSSPTTGGRLLDGPGEVNRSHRERRVTSTAPETSVEGEAGLRWTPESTRHRPSPASATPAARTSTSRASRARTVGDVANGSPVGTGNESSTGLATVAPVVPPAASPRSTRDTTGGGDPPLSLYRPSSSGPVALTADGPGDESGATAGSEPATNGPGSAFESSTGEATPSTASPPPVDADPSPAVPTGADLDQVVDRVYHSLERRMRVERERRGY